MGNIQLLNKHKAYRNYSAGLGQCNDFCCSEEVELNARGYLHLTMLLIGLQITKKKKRQKSLILLKARHEIFLQRQQCHSGTISATDQHHFCIALKASGLFSSGISAQFYSPAVLRDAPGPRLWLPVLLSCYKCPWHNFGWHQPPFSHANPGTV